MLEAGSVGGRPVCRKHELDRQLERRFDPDSPHCYEVAITDSGEKAYDEILPRYWPEGVVND